MERLSVGGGIATSKQWCGPGILPTKPMYSGTYASHDLRDAATDHDADVVDLCDPDPFPVGGGIGAVLFVSATGRSLCWTSPWLATSAPPSLLRS